MQPHLCNQARINQRAHKGAMFALSRQSFETFLKQNKKSHINVSSNVRKKSSKIVEM